ncbi:MAG: OmpH family outer membrane protein [Candidatus Zixiibacteriota bacterium]
MSVKRFPVILFLLSFMFMASSVFSQQIKIGYVDTNRLKMEYKEYADAKTKFDQQLALWQEQADSLQQEIINMQEELNTQRMLLSEDKRAEKEQKILAKQLEYEEFARKILGPEGEAARREFELSKPLIDKINAAINLIALRDSYTLILDTAGGDILYAKDEMDITNKVLQSLREQ